MFRGVASRHADAFVTALERGGGELAVKTPVTRILLEDGRVTGVEIEGGRKIAAQIVVSNADARHTFEDMIGIDQLPTSYARRLQRLKRSASACVLYGATTHDVMQYEPAHETFIYKHWEHDDTWQDVLAGKPAVKAPLGPPSAAPPAGKERANAHPIRKAAVRCSIMRTSPSVPPRCRTATNSERRVASSEIVPLR